MANVLYSNCLFGCNRSALGFRIGRVSDYKSIDKTWMINTCAKVGPFGIIDIIGMQTVYNIALMNGQRTNNQEMIDRANKIKEEWIDKGETGIASGEEFYKYPNPAYQDSNFLS